jgi:hypothetical protein
LDEVVTQKHTRKSFLLIKELGAIQRCQNWVIQLKKQSRLAKFYEELATLGGHAMRFIRVQLAHFAGLTPGVACLGVSASGSALTGTVSGSSWNVI